MNKENSTRVLVELVISTLVAVVLALISIYLPLLGMVTLILWPLPITYLYMKYNIKFALISFLVTGVILIILVGPFQAFSIMLLFGISSIVMGYCIKKSTPASVTILYMSITFFICIIALFYVLKIFMNVDLVGLLRQAMEMSIETAKNAYLEIGVPSEVIEEAIGVINPDLVLMMIPGALVVVSAVFSYITYSIAGFLFKRFGYNLNRLRKFSEWYMTFNIAFGLILFTVVGLILNANGITIGENLYLNSMAVFHSMFKLVGLSSAAFFLRKKRMAKGLVFVILLVLLISPLSDGLELLGIFDYCFDIRKLDTNRKRFVNRK